MNLKHGLAWLINFLCYWLAYTLLLALRPVYFPTRTYGQHHIPRKGSFIFASNHISNLDPPLLGLCARRRISYLAKESLFKNPVLGFLLRQFDAFPINREKPDIGALREALRRLKAGRPLAVFPEGTRGEPGQTREARNGIGFLVLKSQVPVIPVKVIDTEGVLPPGRFWFHRHPVTVVVGEPMTFRAEESHAQIAQRIMDRIHSLTVPFSS